jgi:two-component system, cell cycle response regulator
MPEMDGVEVCRRIREKPAMDPVYIILLTALNDEKFIVEGLDAGANDYLTKPYRKEELRARISVGQRMLELQAELNQAREALEHEATHDSLTGLLNRRAALAGLSREMSRAGREGSTLSVGLCDIDYFKKVNDQFGHQVGDEVLAGFAKILQNNVRDYDLVSRYGGEEFLIIAPQTRGTSEDGLYERMRGAVQTARLETRQGAKSITVSIGVSGGGTDLSPDALLAAADGALYKAKQRGRNQVVYSSRISVKE